MPTSEKQIKANRQNAQKSTGPVTVQGKAASSRNALKHGMLSGDIVINSPYLQECREDYDALLASLREDLHPEGRAQEFLVVKIANCLWRCRRAAIAETAHINSELEDTDWQMKKKAGRYTDESSEIPAFLDSEEGHRVHDILTARKLLLDEEFNENLMRYEMRLERQITRTLALLAHLKRTRRPSTSVPRLSGGPSSSVPHQSGGPSSCVPYLSGGPSVTTENVQTNPIDPVPQHESPCDPLRPSGEKVTEGQMRGDSPSVPHMSGVPHDESKNDQTNPFPRKPHPRKFILGASPLPSENNRASSRISRHETRQILRL
jgi:hypothetical protein